MAKRPQKLLTKIILSLCQEYLRPPRATVSNESHHRWRQDPNSQPCVGWMPPPKESTRTIVRNLSDNCVRPYFSRPLNIFVPLDLDSTVMVLS